MIILSFINKKIRKYIFNKYREKIIEENFSELLVVESDNLIKNREFFNNKIANFKYHCTVYITNPKTKNWFEIRGIYVNLPFCSSEEFDNPRELLTVDEKTTIKLYWGIPIERQIPIDLKDFLLFRLHCEIEFEYEKINGKYYAYQKSKGPQKEINGRNSIDNIPISGLTFHLYEPLKNELQNNGEMMIGSSWALNYVNQHPLFKLIKIINGIRIGGILLIAFLSFIIGKFF